MGWRNPWRVVAVAMATISMVARMTSMFAVSSKMMSKPVSGAWSAAANMAAMPSTA